MNFHKECSVMLAWHSVSTNLLYSSKYHRGTLFTLDTQQFARKVIKPLDELRGHPAACMFLNDT